MPNVHISRISLVNFQFHEKRNKYFISQFFSGWGGICGGGCFGTKKMSVKATTTSCISLCSKHLIHQIIPN